MKIGRLRHVRSLVINNRYLNEMPRVWKIRKLETLNISRNRLSQLSDSYAALQNLEVLRIQENRLSIFPNFILQLPNVREVNVAQNQLSDLPIEKLMGLPKLSFFHANSNPFIPEFLESQLVKEFLQKGENRKLNYVITGRD